MKRIMTELALVTAILFLTATMNAFAEGREHDGKKHHGEKGPRHHPSIKKMDTDQNGEVTFKEFKAAHIVHMEKRFKKMDRNGDGVISREDHDAARQQHMDRFFEQADTNGDGQLSKDEMKAAKHHGKSDKDQRD